MASSLVTSAPKGLTMRRTSILPIIVACIAMLLGSVTAFAGNPHFVSVSAPQLSGASNETITVLVKEAGLGDEAQIVAVLSGDAQCVNPGGNEPQASNKQSLSKSRVIPVQNGKADYSISLTATFQPNCSPPMSVVWSNLMLTDTTNGLVYRF
jgi:hypothetical protein